MAFIGLGAFTAWLGMERSSEPRLPFSDSFSQDGLAKWQAFGGSWEVHDGAVRNASDERGAKLLTGNSSWSDYSVEADVQLLGNAGDAGLIVRSNDEENGVDSYSGYYVGIRNSNNTVTIGRADHGWMEYQVANFPGGIQGLQWYHLRVVAVGCDVAAIVYDPRSKDSATVAMHEAPCVKAGRLGLRSYSSGGIWKNIRARAASIQEIKSILATHHPAESPDTLQTEAGFNSAVSKTYSASNGPWNAHSQAFQLGAQAPPLSSLRLVSPLTPPVMTVHGSVVFTSPTTFLEDSTGGIEVTGIPRNELRIGDEVEITGLVTPKPFSAEVSHAKIRFLWPREPAPPLAISPTQGATGQFDAMFVELEGTLAGRPAINGERTVLNLINGREHYQAILIGGTLHDDPYTRFTPGSVVRLRGICVTDSKYTHNAIPFAILLRSRQDVTLVAGPPWWSVEHLLEISAALLFLCAAIVLFYVKAERWRLKAVVDERSRMAREIHDTLAQGFAGITFQLESALREDVSSGVDSECVEMALQMARQSRKEAHITIAALRTLDFGSNSLPDTISNVVAPQFRNTGVELKITSDPNVSRMSAEVETQIIRVIQEAIANALQHAKPSQVTLVIEKSDAGVIVTVQDDGEGFEVETAPSVADGHFGIAGMIERAESIGATLQVRSGRDGTFVTLVVPTIREGRSLRAHLISGVMARVSGIAARLAHLKGGEAA